MTPLAAPPAASGDARARRTLQLERRRACCSGILDTAGSTFFMLILIRVFDGDLGAKAWMSTAGNLGLFCTPLVIACVARSRWHVSRAAALVAAVSALCYGAMALWPHPQIFVAGAIATAFLSLSYLPLRTHLMQENFPASSRGRWFAQLVVLKVIAAAAFAAAAGRLLDYDLAWHRLVLCVFALAQGLSAWLTWRIPSDAMPAPRRDVSRHPLRCIGEDRLFRRSLATWMFAGFAGHLLLPLRVEYLVNPAHGLALAPGQVAWLTAVIPGLVSCAATPLCGWAFDRANFFGLRALLFLATGCAMATFYASDHPHALLIGAALFGLSQAGNEVVWALWVTKLAPPGHGAEYMAAHLLGSGLRAVIGPAVGFTLLGHSSFGFVLATAVTLLGGAGICLLFELREARRSGRLT